MPLAPINAVATPISALYDVSFDKALILFHLRCLGVAARLGVRMDYLMDCMDGS